MSKWTRERIIRELLALEARKAPLGSPGRGLNELLYQAGTRIFGSWINALKAAGIVPERGGRDYWTPPRILTTIRQMARSGRPITRRRIVRRHGRLLSAAARLFGSWPKAILAAGLDPEVFHRVTHWTPERVIEVILTRSLRNEPLGPSSARPRSMVTAGIRFFGDWAAALTAAGVEATATPRPPRRAPAPKPQAIHTARARWSREEIIAALHARLAKDEPIHSSAIRRDDRKLRSAMRRCFPTWADALLAAGLDPEVHRGRRPGPAGPPPKSQVSGPLGPDPPG